MRTQTLALIALLALAAACFWPGLRGPWLFDDFFNILDNAALRLDRPDSASLLRAAFAVESGPLRRPVAYLTLALNHYFADGTASTFPFKLTNLAIHLLNVLLVWALAGLIGRRRRPCLRWPPQRCSRCTRSCCPACCTWCSA